MTGRKPPSEELLAKERRALELRRAGLTYDRIAAQLGYTNKSAAKKAVERGIQRTLQEPADELRVLETDRLDRLQTALWPGAMEGDEKKALAILKLMERRSKLLGLDVPVRQELTGPGGSPLVIEVLPDLLPTMTDPDTEETGEEPGEGTEE